MCIGDFFIISFLSTMDHIGHYEFLCEPFHCDFNQRLLPGHLGNHLLNAADFHSNDRGFGMTHLNAQHKTWVLSRLAVEIDEMPRIYSRFFIDTWVETAMRFFTHRNFHLYDVVSNKTYGYGRSVWAMIDTGTRQPCNIFDINDGVIGQYVVTDKENPMTSFLRVKMGEQTEWLRTVDTTYNDVDINGHINSLKYLDHILDLYTLDWYRAHPLRRFDIAYVAETHFGDQLVFYREQADPLTHHIRVCKREPQEETEVEVVRCQLKFL